jgi:hypothetical protein
MTQPAVLWVLVTALRLQSTTNLPASKCVQLGKFQSQVVVNRQRVQTVAKKLLLYGWRQLIYVVAMAIVAALW